MGAADIVPGVSGGTMAFILGIYEELIESIRGFGRRDFLTALVRLRFREIFEIINWQFLLAVGTGIGVAVLTLARGLGWLLENHQVYVWSFFFGLVLASVIAVSRRIDRWPPQLGATLVLGAVASYILVGLLLLQQPPDTWWFLLLAGALASCAMILPGISGAFILLLLGKYSDVLGAVRSFDIGLLFFVAAGAVVGLVSFSQVLGWVFRKYHDLTVALLIGLMLGSLRKVWPWKEDLDWLQEAGEFVVDSHDQRKVIEQAMVLPDVSTSGEVGQVVAAVALALAGFGGIVLLDRFAAGGKAKG